MKTKLLILFFISCSSFSQKEYHKSYYTSGQLKEEGWIANDKKTGYWLFYYQNGLKKEEGHFKDNARTKWWIFYDEQQKITKKCEFRNNILNGITIVYSDGKITRAEKYSNGTKLKTWTNIDDFKKDNFFLK